MIRYPAFIDGEAGAYGVVFAHMDAVVAMGETQDEAILNAHDALRDAALDAERDGGALPAPTPLEEARVPEGATLVSIPLIRESGKAVLAKMASDETSSPLSTPRPFTVP